jgi:hypothetical protein
MENKVLEFINKRFLKDNNWLKGNCYYFALILKDRFNGTILYDVIDGHFVTLINNIKYDWTGIISEDGKHYYVEWDKFDDYDSNQKQSIINGCLL